jgi:hypothetical protein
MLINAVNKHRSYGDAIVSAVLVTLCQHYAQFCIPEEQAAFEGGKWGDRPRPRS